MTTQAAPRGRLYRGCLVALGCLVVCIGGVCADPVPDARAPVLTLSAALQYSLENNPSLAAQRQQRGIAEARVVIADTYPFNPVLENRIQGANGPASADITNRVALEHVLLWEVEWRHQRRHRRDGAAAALSRTDWEI